MPDPDPTFHFDADADHNADPVPYQSDENLWQFWASTSLLWASTAILSLHSFWFLNLMRFRILLLTLMGNRIRVPKMMRIRIGNTFLQAFFLTCKKNMGSSREEEVVVVSSRSSSSSAPASEGSGFSSRPRTVTYVEEFLKIGTNGVVNFIWKGKCSENISIRT